MNYIIPITTCAIIAVIFYLAGRSDDKKFALSPEWVTKEAIKAAKFTNTLNPLIMDVYKLFVSKYGTDNFSESYCHIIVNGDINIEFWDANTVDSRRFTIVPDETLRKYNLTLDELNKSLSLIDKEILDRIAKAVMVNNKEFIERIFI